MYHFMSLGQMVESAATPSVHQREPSPDYQHALLFKRLGSERFFFFYRLFFSDRTVEGQTGNHWRRERGIGLGKDLELGLELGSTFLCL